MLNKSEMIEFLGQYTSVSEAARVYGMKRGAFCLMLCDIGIYDPIPHTLETKTAYKHRMANVNSNKKLREVHESKRTPEKDALYEKTMIWVSKQKTKT